MNEIMLDLETLGTNSDAAVVSIGACAFDLFDEAAPIDTFHARVRLDDAVYYGSVTGDTLQFWFEQSEEARRLTFQKDGAMSLVAALSCFNTFVRNYGPKPRVWGNSSTFDNVILRSAYRAAKMVPAWHFRGDSCYRTVINLLPKSSRPVFERVGVHHNAVDDAVTQARYLQKVMRILFPPFAVSEPSYSKRPVAFAGGDPSGQDDGERRS